MIFIMAIIFIVVSIITIIVLIFTKNLITSRCIDRCKTSSNCAAYNRHVFNIDTLWFV